MFVRRRPLLRAAAVGGGAYAMGRRSARRAAAQEQQESEQDARTSDLERDQAQSAGTPAAAVPAQSPPPAEPAAPSLSDQLARLSTLHQQGALNDAEFAAAKSRLLGS